MITMTVNELADFFGKSPATVRRAANTAELEHAVNGAVRQYEKNEVIKISSILFKTLPSSVKESIELTFSNDKGQPLPNGKVDNYVTKDDLKEFAKTIITEIMSAVVPLIQGSTTIKSKQLAYVPESDQRTELNRLIKTHAFENSIDQHSCWTKLYNDVYDRLHIDIRTRAKNLDIDKLDYAVKEGLLPQLITIVMGW